MNDIKKSDRSDGPTGQQLFSTRKKNKPFALRKKNEMVRDPSRLRKDGEGQPKSNRAHHERHAEDRKVYKGLCASCAHRENCLLPEAEGGVWHCEQYVEEC